ncbi:hypothetical protein ACJX0J_031588, partial [Zea mays]
MKGVRIVYTSQIYIILPITLYLYGTFEEEFSHNNDSKCFSLYPTMDEVNEENGEQKVMSIFLIGSLYSSIPFLFSHVQIELDKALEDAPKYQKRAEVAEAIQAQQDSELADVRLQDIAMLDEIEQLQKEYNAETKACESNVASQKIEETFSSYLKGECTQEVSIDGDAERQPLLQQATEVALMAHYEALSQFGTQVNGKPIIIVPNHVT